MTEPRVLAEFTYPAGSMFEGPGRLIVRAAARGRTEPEIVLQREGYEPGTWKDHPAENATEAAALVYAATLAACATAVRAAGCLCAELLVAYGEGAGEFLGTADGGYWSADLRIRAHDPRCPHALAAAIEARRG